MYFCSKTFGHDLGLSCAYRQWKADSHCSKIHGYSLAVKLEFTAYTLDSNNWVLDFGDFGEIKTFLEQTFDHKLLVAEDDPELDMFYKMRDLGICELSVITDSISCETFARLIFMWVDHWLHTTRPYTRVVLHKVTVSEHGANSASFTFPVKYEGMHIYESP